MNIIEKPPVEELPDQSLLSEAYEGENNFQPKISGFDGGTRPILKEPSLYLSSAIVFIAAFVCFGKTPIMFWSTLAAMTAVVVGIHVMAERFLFKRNPEHRVFTAPFEGVFVITFGAILPGLALLAYGAFAIATVHDLNIAEEIGKFALLLVVPLFNFLCWSAIRKGYLVRPRVTGLMTGFALGLSTSWTAIFLRTIFVGHSDSACKFGWMLLLCTSPFLLFAAVCLSLDLWNKTDATIRRITTTFSILGILLSAVFVFTPMARAMWVQSLINDAKVATKEDRAKAISALREAASDQDLRPSKYPVSGFSLAELLISNRGLVNTSDDDKHLYFETTGESILSEGGSKNSKQEQGGANGEAVAKIPGLALVTSQLSGNIDAASYSSSVDWTMTFKSANASADEARCEIGLPKNAVVSRATLWINGEPREAAFASTTSVKDAYQAVVRQQRDPLLVTMPTSDHVLVQCFPISANTGEMKIRIGFKVPLETVNGESCSLELPKLLSSNFDLPKRQRANFFSHDMVARSISGIEVVKTVDGYSLSGVIKNQQDTANVNSLTVLRTAPRANLVIQDSFSHQPRYIVEQLKEVTTPSLKRLAIVIDTSASLKRDVDDIRNALAAVPAGINTTVYFAGEQDADKEPVSESPSNTIEQAKELIKTESFIGGHNNWATLRDALENTAELSNGAVLWIHGPQPIAAPVPVALDLVHHVSVYDMQIENGPNAILPALQTADVAGIIASEKVNHKSTVPDIKSLVANWEKPKKGLAVQMTSSTVRPPGGLVADKAVSAQISCLWAKEEVARLLASGQAHEALVLGSNYRIISPISGAVVLENARAYDRSGLKLPEFAVFAHPSVRHGGLVGAAVDPAFGQANEVGMLADFGYDTARDIGRFLTLASFIISIMIATLFLRRQKKRTLGMIMKAVLVLFAVPTAVHLVGIFMINNFGGLGGGL
jgi:hypothetical protein